MAVPADGYRKLLRKVGIALVTLGLLDIGVMVYCIARWESYSSCFNVLAVTAGILLLRGNLRAARVVALFSAFLFTGFAGLALIFPVVMRLPLALVWVCLRLHPLATIGFPLLFLALLAVLAWTYRTLTKPAVLAAMDQQQIDYRHWRYRPSGGFAGGALVLVIVFAFVGASLRAGAVAQAKAEARERVGPGYQLFVSQFSSTSGFGGPADVRATVVAYNDHEIRTVPVAFRR